MIARLIIVPGMMILYILFEGWWSVDAEPRLAADLHRSGLKAHHKRSIRAAPSLRSQYDRSCIILRAEERSLKSFAVVAA